MSVLTSNLHRALQEVAWQLDNCATASPAALGELIGRLAAYTLGNGLASEELINTAEAIMNQFQEQQTRQLATNVMLDLETLGTRPGCKVLSIGAVVFGPAGLGATFYTEMDMNAQPGLEADQDTLDWWAKQAPEARDRLFSNTSVKPTLGQGTAEFSKWLNTAAPGALVWGNGADFDNPILAAAYAVQGLKQPWGTWNGRCYRTLKALRPDVKLVRSGTHHNALDDARSQADHATRILNAMGGWEQARAKR